MLEVRNLSKSFHGHAALNNISCVFDEGVYGILGPNGAGKTTLLRHLVNIYRTRSGNILYQGEEITHISSYNKMIGYLPQKFGLFRDLKLGDALRLFANLKCLDSLECGEGDIEKVLTIVHLKDQIDQKVGTLSGGMLRRAGIAQALLGNPQIIIFDEPTAGLDPEERLRFKSIISDIKCEKIIIISTHIVEDVESICDHVLVMDQGNILTEGTCAKIRGLANGKVYLVSANETQQIAGEYIIEQKHSDDTGTVLRILTSAAQPFPSVKPTLEDGYMCILKHM